MYEGINILTTCDGVIAIPFQYLKAVVALENLSLSETGSQFIFPG